MRFQKQSLTLGIIMIQESCFHKINQEREGRRDKLVSPEDNLATHDERKTDKIMKIKYKHTEFESS